MGSMTPDIAVRNMPHRNGNARAVWDHTVLPPSRGDIPAFTPGNNSWYSI